MSETVYRPALDIVVRRVGDESVVVPVRNRVGDLDSIFTLNEVASRVWDLLDGQRPVDDIVGVICQEFEVTPEVAGSDVRELLDSLEQAHLVEAVAE